MPISQKFLLDIFRINKVSSLQELLEKNILEAKISGFSVTTNSRGILVMNVDNEAYMESYAGLTDEQKVKKYITDLNNSPG